MHKQVLIGAVVIALLILGGVGFYLYNEYQAVRATLETKIQELEGTLAQTTVEKDQLSEALFSEQRKNEEFEEQIEDLSGTVDTLETLSKTDRELLQKYSKVYFLNENYSPTPLSDIDNDYLLRPTETEEFHGKIIDHLEDMLDEADDDDIDLKVLSGFRSFETQKDLKGQYTFTYGTGANAFSADQGYSEHQLGTTVDLTTPAVGGAYVSFGSTEAFTWLQDNAYKYGFVLSYPEGNAYYQYEPWHWRYVGLRLAKDLRKDKENFYDMDQRDIDDYLINFFE